MIFRANKLKQTINGTKSCSLFSVIAFVVMATGCFEKEDSHGTANNEEFSFEGDFLATDDSSMGKSFISQDTPTSSSDIDFSLDDLFLDSSLEEVPIQQVPSITSSIPPQKDQSARKTPTGSGQQKINNAIQQKLVEQDRKIEALIENSTNLKLLLEQERQKNLSLQKKSPSVAMPQDSDNDRYNALLMEKKELEERLSALEQKLLGGNLEQLNKPPAPLIPLPQHDIPEPVDVELQAEVNYVNGKTSAAFFTAFYITTQSLDEIVQELNEDWLQEYGIQNTAELWARAIKNPYEFPDVANQIRRALSTSRVARVSTNMQGSANFKDVLTGEYYIIGAAPLGQIGVVWSLPIDITKTTDSIYLSGENASWSL